MASGGSTALAGLLSLLACAQVRHDVPALITNPTAESRAELLGALRDALNGASLTIADDALTRESSLVIERAPARDARGLPLNGRDRGRPERFRLVKDASRCVLVHEASGKRWTLSSATCAARR